MAKGITAQLKANITGKGLILGGLGIEVGRQSLIALEHAVGNVINAIPDMIHKGQQFALTVDDISDKTGASAENASRFAGTLQYLGISTSGLGMSLKTLSADIVNSEEKFQKLDIQTRDANDDLLDTITILNNVRTYLSGAGDDATKMALAADLLGRSAGDLIDFLNLTDEQAAALGDTLDELGVTIGEDARRDAESLARETNLLGLAWQGFANILFSDVAPAIRTVIGGATAFIKEHGAEIRDTIIDMTSAVLGFVAGLVGIDTAIPFQSTLDGLSSSADDVSLSFEQWAQQTGRVIPVVEKATGASKANTDALDKQIKSVDRLSASETKRDQASETIFQRTMKRLAGEYGARLDALDLEERQLAMADRDAQLTEQLRQAKIDLFEAQAQLRADAMAGEPTDRATLDVAGAQQGVIDAQKAIADEAVQRDRDAQRARLEGVKTYIEDLARIEEQSENKKALANTLEKRRAKLTAALAVATQAGAADDIADITARLEAVKTAEERTGAAIRSQAKQTELEGLKAQLQRQREAIKAAGSGQVSDNAKTLAALKAQYQKYLTEQQTDTVESVNFIGALIKGNVKSGTGLGGAITKAFADGQVSGEAFRKKLGEIADAIGDVIDWFAKLGEDPVFKLLTEDVGGSGTKRGERVKGDPSPSGKPRPLIADAGDALGNLNDILGGGGFDVDDINREIARRRAAGKVPARAAGGPVNKDQNYLVGERGPEIFRPNEDGMIVPNDRFPREMVVPKSMADWLRDFLSGHTSQAGYASGMPRREDGGPVMRGQPFIGNEERQEFFVPSENGTIIPSLSALGGWDGGGKPAVIRVEIGGNPLLDYIDEGLSYRHRR